MGPGPIHRHALWIRAHPWRMLGAPILLVAVAIALSIVLPDKAREAALLLVGAVGVGGIAWSLIWLPSAYIEMREQPLIALIRLAWHGGTGLAILGFSLLFLYAFVWTALST